MGVIRRLLVALVCVVLAVGCAGLNPDYDAKRIHHTQTGFRNPYAPPKRDQGLLDWQWERWRSDLSPQDAGKVPVAHTDPALLRSPNTGVRVTWFGQDSVLLQFGTTNLLIDPMFSSRASPVQWIGPQRAVPLPIDLRDLPHIDAVLISHNHYDNLDADSIAALAAQPGGPPDFIVPLGVDRWFAANGYGNVRKLDWWDHVSVGGVEVTLTPSQHWSQRTLFDRDASLWGGYLMRFQDYAAWFAGETGYSPELFDDIGARFRAAFGRVDFAMIPVGCYLPRWFMAPFHVNPEEALRIHKDVQSRLSMGVSWGTFRLCDDPVEQPMVDLPVARRALGVADDAFVLFSIGETRRLR